MKSGGYYTVEATFVVSVCVWVIVALCYGGFFIHDRLVMESRTNQMAYKECSDKMGSNLKKWEKKCKEELNDSLYLMKVKTVSASQGICEINVTVRCQLPISFRFLKRALSEGKPELIFKTSREKILPAEYKWDYDMIEK